MKLRGKIIMLLMIGSFLSAIDLSAQAGGSSVPFLLISPDAAASGRGETGTGLANDLNAVYWNPAGLGFFDYFPETSEYSDEPEDIPYRQFALAYSKWLPQFNADLHYSFGTYGQYVEQLDGVVAINLIFMNLGEFTRTSENGTVLGTFNANEYSLGLSYGTMIAQDLAMGIQLRVIQSNLTPTSAQQSGDAGSGTSGGFDFGLLWKPSDLDELLDDKFSIGFNLQNVGPKITYISESDPLPTNLRLGVAYSLFKDEYNDLTILADMSKLLVYRDSLTADPVPKSFITAWKNPGVDWALGMEYWYNQIFAMRAGYFSEPAVLGNRRFWNFGAGIRYDIFHMDFSYINAIEENHPLAGTMRFSMLVDWK